MYTDSAAVALVIHGDVTPPTRLRWHIARGNNIIQHGQGIDELRRELDQRGAESPAITTWIVPAEKAAITEVLVPSDKPQHIRAAVPNLLEESLASEVDELHISTGLRTELGRVPVVAVDHAWLANGLAQLHGEHLDCARVCVDALLLPCHADAVTLLLHGDRALLRWGKHSAGAIELDALESLLSAILNHTLIRRLHVMALCDDTVATDTFIHHRLPILRDVHSLVVDVETIEDSLLNYLTSRLQTNDPHAIDLLQGDFARSLAVGQIWRRWRPLGWAIGGLFAAQLVLNCGMGLYLQQRAESVHAKTETLYRELFPSDKRIVDLHRQVHSQLGSMGAGERRSFLELLGHLAQQIESTNVGTSPIRLRALLYDADTGVLQVDLLIANVQSLDDLQKRLAAEHLTVKVLSAAAGDEGAFTGRLSIAGR